MNKPKITYLREKGEFVVIRYLVDGDEHQIKSSDIVSEGFAEALDELAEAVCRVCQFPIEDADKISVLGFTVSKKGDNDQVTFQAKKDLGCGTPLNIPTPNRLLEEDSGDSSILLDAKSRESLKKLQAEAASYIENSRTLRQIFLPLFEEEQEHEEAA
ncbi:hypothetical protein [Rubellicoccus peritrichatus]|uniref:Uncharacterized protein n=1 Tax=Rubellicoccus peritrichatus TaxID=3080537 RepID=A0AAQ3LCU3_9BACT|nr:hypothetical protein [Puniceicoccus sp. CR14]WOO43136.1 hypothetical protein RZN69_08525 [Puniceicoccus sp. CR14]